MYFRMKQFGYGFMHTVYVNYISIGHENVTSFVAACHVGNVYAARK